MQDFPQDAPPLHMSTGNNIYFVIHYHQFFLISIISIYIDNIDASSASSSDALPETHDVNEDTRIVTNVYIQIQYIHILIRTHIHIYLPGTQC